jgi:hypothetical protein
VVEGDINSRAHKLTFQAMWKILYPQFHSFLQIHDGELAEKLTTHSSNGGLDGINDLITQLSEPRFYRAKEAFTEEKGKNINFKFWWHYLEMVSILLMFTQAQRDGDWYLHLYSFRCMLPYFMRYDHSNYARWGTVYLAEMNHLPEEVETEFKQGNFVVKRSNQKFNQVDPDQSQEWMNGTGKRGGGIVGITKTPTALSRWALSYNMRSHIAADTRELYHLGLDDNLTHNESTTGRQRKDTLQEDALLANLHRFDVFSPTANATLQNIATKDLATREIESSLIRVAQQGQKQLETFVTERMKNTRGEPGHGNANPPAFHDPLPRNNAPTFASLYEVGKGGKGKDKQTVMKADRNLHHRLIVAYEAGRTVDLKGLLQHELMPVPVSIAEMNGTLRTGSKSLLADTLTAGITCPQSITIEDSSCIIFDGQALVNAIGKPTDAKTFGDLADTFVKAVLQAGSSFDRIDVTFDRYKEDSIKSGTRQHRTKSAQPIRRMIESRQVPLPNSWTNFMALPENKADLARLLSEELIIQAPNDKVVVVAGGFEEEDKVISSQPTLDVTGLRASHEEADTRMVLHAIHSEAATIVVSATDTDVLLLLVAHSSRCRCTQLWMKAGTAKKRKYIPIKEVHSKLPPGSDEALLAFHALTGSDTTSFVAGHSKQTAYKVFQEHHHLLIGLGDGEPTDEKVKSAESFICRLYKVPAIIESADQARSILFAKASTPEALPPTSDALKFHILRAHYQAIVWKQAHIPKPDIPAPDQYGWKRDQGQLIPVLMSKQAIPQECMELVSCQCSKGCRTMCCKCRKTRLQCTSACKCSDSEGDIACINYY